MQNSKIGSLLDSLEEGPQGPSPSATPAAQAKSKVGSLLDALDTAPPKSDVHPIPPPDQIQEPSRLGGFLSEVGHNIMHPLDALSEASKPLLNISSVTTSHPESDPSQASSLVEQGYDPAVGPYVKKGQNPADHPVKAAIADAASSMTSPANLGIIAATGAVGAAAAEAGPASQVAKTVLKGVGLGFSSQMAGASGQAVQKALTLKQAFDELTKTYEGQLRARSMGVLPPSIDPEHTRLMADSYRKQAKYALTSAGINGGLAALGAMGLAHESMPEAVPPSIVGDEGPIAPGPAADASHMSADAEVRAEPERAAREAAEAAANPNPGGAEAQADYEARMKRPISTPYGRRQGTSAQPVPGRPGYSPEEQAAVKEAAEAGQREAEARQAADKERTDARNAGGATWEAYKKKQAGGGLSRMESFDEGDTQGSTQEHPQMAAPGAVIAPSQVEGNVQNSSQDNTELANSLAIKHDIKPSDAKKIVDEVLGVQPQKALPPSPRYVEPKPNEELTGIANEYNQSVGLPPVQHKPFEVNENNSKAIADFYDKAESRPDDPEVKAAYKAFTDETHKQYEFLLSKGYKPVLTDQPVTYNSVEDLNADLAKKQLRVWTGEAPEHGLITPEQNIEFRFVHDIMGHALPNASAGHGGEESAFASHLQMYSPEAQKAMATETRGQNAALHFGDAQGNSMPDNYDPSFKVSTDGIKYPPQKATILPQKFRTVSDHLDTLERKSSPEAQAAGNQEHAPLVQVTTHNGVPILRLNKKGVDAVGMSPGEYGLTSLNPSALASKPGIAGTPIARAIYHTISKNGDKPLVIIRHGLSPEEEYKTVQHEVAHVKSFLHTPDEAYDHPMVKKAMDALANGAYAGSSRTVLGNEFIAHAISNGLDQIKLTPEQAAEGLFHVIDKMMTNSLYKTAADVHNLLGPQFKGIKNELSQRYGGALAKPAIQLPGGELQASRDVREADVRNGGAQEVHERRGDGGVQNPDEGPLSRRDEEGVRKYLTPGERKSVSDPRALAKVQAAFDELPSDFTTAAKLGSAGRYWYENSTKALHNYFGDDSEQFTNLLASYSPRQLVKDNLKTALAAWNEWDAAGRPVEAGAIESILDKHAGGKAFGGRFQNAVRSLQGVEDPLSGQKVNSFYQNLIGNTKFVTNDTWMAKFGSVAHAVLGNKIGYLALTAKVREAANELGWSPQQVQSGVWVFTKALWELGVQGKPPKEVVTRLNLHDAKDLTDFATIFTKDADVRATLSQILERQGKSLESIESAFKKKDLPKQGPKETVNPQSARKVAERLSSGIDASRAARVAKASEARRAKDESVRQTTLFRREDETEKPDRSNEDEIVSKRGNRAGGTVELRRRRDGSTYYKSTSEPYVEPKEKPGLDEVNENRKRIGLSPVEKLEPHSLPQKGDAFKKLTQPEFGKEVPLDKLQRGFIGSDGRGVQTILDHLDSLDVIGLKPLDKGKFDEGWPATLHENGLIRFVKTRGFNGPGELSIEMGGKPTSAQMRAIQEIAVHNPSHTFTYDLHKDGKRVKSAGNVDFDRFQRDVNLTYRPGEVGAVRIGKPLRNPIPKSAEYKKVFDAQNGLGPKPSLSQRYAQFLAAVDAKSLNATRKLFDKWVDVKNVVEGAKKAGINISPKEDPYIGLQIGFGGGNGGFAATMLDTFDILKDAKKAKLEPETTAYFNLIANKRAIDVIKEKEAEARAAGRIKEADEYADKLANSKVAAGGFNENSIKRDLIALEASVTPDQWKQVKGFAAREFQLNRDALDFLHGRGRISDAAYQKMIARGPEYITMTRILDNIENAQYPGGRAMSVKSLESIKSLEGSELINQSPWVADPIRRGLAYREEARMAPVEQLHDLAIKHPFFASFVRELGPSEKLKKYEGEINYIRKGKPVRLAVPDVLSDAMKLTSAHDTRILGQALLGNVASIVRPSLTGMNLAYAATSPLREAQDALTYLVRSPKDFASYVSEFGKAMGHIVSKDQVYREALRAGVAYTSIQSRIDPLTVIRNKTMRDLVSPNTSITNGLMAIPDTIAGANEALQIAGKMAARQMLINNGMEPVEATAQARIFAGRPDVANAGTMTSQINPLLLFMVDKLKGAERSHIFFKKFPKYAIAASLAYLMAELATNRYNSQFTSPEYERQREEMLASDEGKDAAKVRAWDEAHKDEILEWNHVSDKDRSNYHILLTPSVVEADDGTLRRFGIKIPRGRAFFGNAARTLWEGVFGQASPSQTMLNEVASALPGDYTLRKGEVISGVARGVGSSVNPLIQEPIAQGMNQDTYTGLPIESEGMQNREPEYRYKENTSPLSIKLGELTKESPLRIEHALRNFGGLGEMVTGLIDKAMRDSDNRVPPGSVEKITRQPVVGPIARRFLLAGVDQTRSNRERDFYDALTRASQAVDTIRGMKGPRWGSVLDKYSNDPETVNLAYIHPDLNDVSQDLHAMRVAMSQLGAATTKDEAGVAVPEWEGDISKLTNEDKRAAVRAIHAEYMHVLNDGLKIVADSKVWQGAARKGNEDEIQTMLNDIINR